MTAEALIRSTPVPPRRAELAAFLRNRRARLSPEDFGLNPGHRRRTPGLRREELALLAGVGVTWYTRLEQGRPINASLQVIDAIAGTLRLDRAEREHLHLLADVPQSMLPSTTVELDPAVQVVIDAIESMPAVVYSSRYDVLAWNALYAALFPALVDTPPPYRNVLWNVFTTHSCYSPWINRDHGLPQMVATLRAAFGRHVGEPSWTEFVRQLSQRSEEFAQMWASHDVAAVTSHVKLFRHGVVGDLSMATSSFPLADVTEARMVVYRPLDAASAQRMRHLRTLCADPSRRPDTEAAGADAASGASPAEGAPR